MDINPSQSSRPNRRRVACCKYLEGNSPPQSPVMWLSKVLRLKSNYYSSGSWSQSYRSKHKILILDQCFFFLALRTWWPLHVCVGLLLSRYAAVQATYCKWADYILLDNSIGLLRKRATCIFFPPLICYLVSYNASMHVDKEN